MNDMRKLINLVEGKASNPDVDYAYAGKTKKATDAGDYTQITATVTGSKSAVFTKLSKQYKVMDMIEKRLTERRKEWNEKVKSRVEDLFDAEDELLTRYVDTVSMALTLSKDTLPSTTETETLDVEGFLNALYGLIDDTLVPKVKELEQAYTKIEEKTTPGRRGGLRAKMKESANEDVSSIASTFKHEADVVVADFDAKLAELKSQFGL